MHPFSGGDVAGSPKNGFPVTYDHSAGLEGLEGDLVAKSDILGGFTYYPPLDPDAFTFGYRTYRYGDRIFLMDLEGAVL
jgi:hypothetical protein